MQIVTCGFLGYLEKKVVPVCISFEAESWEGFESTILSCSKEPLEETPQKAEGEELAQCSHLFPGSEICIPIIYQQIRDM